MPLSRARKQRIALEFGYVNIVFLHDAPQPGLSRKVEIFSKTGERSFSGRAVLGAAHYIFQKLEAEDSILISDWSNLPAAEIQQKRQAPKSINRCTLETEGGLIQAHYDPARQVAAIEIPHNIHIHARETTKDEVLAVQREGAPTPFCGCVYFLQLQTDFTEEPYITRLRVRVIAAGLEETASASGCSALAAYLALQKGGANSRHAYAIEQGVDIGRASQLRVEKI
ncbi:predicted protein [Histoplasma mississippiense (nom. inval.)]|uniref:predicted protein n=1 Tax=Ajellomyces capsulatus (strain NAm1 / WU24) TaxID=2059318 RepID=UPI000157C77F|nr:predicted protein [Histoplasma mississippiense (nom. inval.)]EDN08890.1 predicted protein [Histoplasma mississippiense (nom. inval.)]